MRHQAEKQGLDDTLMARSKEIADSMRASLFPQQLAVIEDPSKNKSGICPRRSGKSWCAMSYASIVCLSKKNARVVIVTLTLKSAKNIYWFEIKDYVRQFGLGNEVDFFVNELRIDFPHGSKIMMIGAESKAQIEKLRGGKYDLVIIDEAKSYPPAVLSELIDDVVEPALMDRDGTMLMIGTPGNILSGPFFESTFPGHKDESGHLTSRTYANPESYWQSHPEDDDWEWSRHEWTLQDNITTPHSWARALKRKKKKRWTDDTPTWQREYLGRWIASELAYVYAYASLMHSDPDKVCWEPDFENGNQFGLPVDEEWHYILGLDLGWEDDFAAVLGAYNPHDGILYHVWEYKDNHQDVDAVAMHILRAIDAAGGSVDKIVGDAGGLGKMVIETLNKRHGLNIEPAEKREKNDFIELLNTDYHSGRVKVQKGSDLSLENQALQWDLGESSKKLLARTGRLKEHPSCPNHLCDAWLYLWRFSYHYWMNDRPDHHAEGSNEWNQEYQRQSMAALVAARTQNLKSTFWDELKSESIDPLKDLDPYGPN
jgi:hypothetical protein